MNLSDEDLQEFQRIWQSAFHEEIPMEEARVIAVDVMQLYSLLGQPKDQRSQSEANQSKRGDEIFSLLQKIERERGSASTVD
jgi:hypothetical protein